MAIVSGEQWGEQQKAVWGDEDPEVFRRVVERIQRQEDEVLREVTRMMDARVVPHALLHYVTNAILRGLDEVESSVPTMTCGEYGAMLDAMRRQVRQRLQDEAGVHAREDEVGSWSEVQLKDATLWMDCMLRRKEGTPHEGDTYDFPPHVAAVVKREADGIGA
jgi:hypothetical protein